MPVAGVCDGVKAEVTELKIKEETTCRLHHQR
jgi:hypothetical protein